MAAFGQPVSVVPRKYIRRRVLWRCMRVEQPTDHSFKGRHRSGQDGMVVKLLVEPGDPVLRTRSDEKQEAPFVT
jgi:hypothetical protein